MYPLTWDGDNGIVLKYSGEGEVLPRIRPVFYEELDLFGFNEFWDYQKCKEPLLWRINRTYYYKGEAVGKINGGGFFKKPKPEVYKEVDLEAIDLERILERNRDMIEKVSNSVLDFIHYTKDKFKDHKTVIGFSGGKDSVVLLDLVQRTLSKDDFIVLFNDTSMELSKNYEFVEEFKKKYQSIKFNHTKHKVPAIEFWKVFGIPSRVHRWCCSLYKMLPTVEFLKKLGCEKILFFDGIRAEENPKRAKMERITKGKNFRQINVHPILNWNSAMVWLYIFERELPINPLYRIGIDRLGCIVCPFESEFWESIIGLAFLDEAEPYLEQIREYAKKRGVIDVDTFISEGNWKARVGGEGWTKNRVFLIKNPLTNIIVESKFEKFTEWLKVVGDVYIGDEFIRVNFMSYDHVLEFKEEENLTIKVINKDEKFLNAIKKIAYKSAYCVGCGMCEITCPYNSIRFNNGSVKVENCVHCGKCLKIADRGCLRAESMKVHLEGKKMGLERIGNYKHFGLRKSWLEEFFKDPDKWWQKNSLGPVQFESMRRWLMDAEMIKKKGKEFEITEIGEILCKIGVESNLTWAVIWTNLVRNSALISWYVKELEWGRVYSREDIIELMGDKLSKNTRDNGLQSLIELFRYSPIGSSLKLGIPISERNDPISLDKKEKIVKIEKRGLEEKAEEFLSSILYSLYRLKSIRGSNFTLGYLEKSSEGPMTIFGIRREKMEKLLRLMQEKFGKNWISVDIVADLDNISISEEKTEIDVLKLAL